MIDTRLAAFVLASVAAGGVAYVFIYPWLSGDALAEKRQKALTRPSDERRDRIASATRRDQITQSLKDLEAKQKARKTTTIENRILQAGLNWTRRGFFMRSAVVGVVLAFIAFVGTGSPFLAAGAAFAGGFGLPRWMLIYWKKRRIAQFISELPNAVDVIVRGIRSGLPLNDCLRAIATDAREPLRSEFRAVVEAQTMGMSAADALARLYERVPTAEANFFAIVIAIQQKAGGNLSEALGNLSKVLRERRKMRDKVNAMSMEAKASAAIIGALPFCVAFLTYLSSPEYISLLWTKETGKIALMGGGLWMICGIFAMKKMINFKV
jgi:tight adherence protein B